MSRNRKYSYKDVDMLVASKTIAESFKIYIEELSLIRSNWTAEYASQLNIKIDNAIQNHLGLDTKKELRNATADLYKLQISAQRDLSFFKVQISEDFKNEPATVAEMLKRLGFTDHLQAVQQKDQEALIQLLYTFKKNMDKGLMQKIVSKGTNPTLIDKIIAYADALRDANIKQEALKGTSKEDSQEVTDAFNTIYDEVITICKIASNYYRNDSIKKRQFTISKVVANMNLAHKLVETK